MSDLTRFRDHARKMAAQPHIVNRDGQGLVVSTFGPTDGERALWTQLADEVDAYLQRNPDEPLPVIDDDQLDLLDDGGTRP